MRVRSDAAASPSSTPTPFGNRALLDGDHAALFVAATQLRRGDSIWFVTEERSASLLALIWQSGAARRAAAGGAHRCWLWRGSARFGPPLAPTELARRSLAEQIRGTGQFTLRFGGGRALHAAEVRALHEAARAAHPGLLAPRGHRERIEALAQLAGIDARRARRGIESRGPRDGRASCARDSTLLESIAAYSFHKQPTHRERS